MYLDVHNLTSSFLKLRLLLTLYSKCKCKFTCTCQYYVYVLLNLYLNDPCHMRAKGGLEEYLPTLRVLDVDLPTGPACDQLRNTIVVEII